MTSIAIQLKDRVSKLNLSARVNADSLGTDFKTSIDEHSKSPGCMQEELSKEKGIRRMFGSFGSYNATRYSCRLLAISLGAVLSGKVCFQTVCLIQGTFGLLVLMFLLSYFRELKVQLVTHRKYRTR